MNEIGYNQQATQGHPEGVRYSPGLFTLTALLIVFVLYQIVGGGISLLITGGSFSPQNVTVARAATLIAQFLLLLLPTLLLIRLQHTKISNAVPWTMPGLFEVFLVIVGMVALLQVAEGYMYFQDMIPLPESIRPVIDKLKEMIDQAYRILVSSSSLAELGWVLAVVAFTPAICEEILFRGLVQKNISLSTNTTKGFIITGIIFGLYHFNPFLTIPLISLGIYFSFLRYRSRSIIVPMIAHFVNNAISTIGVYVYGYDNSDMPSLLSDNQSVISVLSTTILFILIFIVAMIMYMNITKKKFQDRQEVSPQIGAGS